MPMARCRSMRCWPTSARLPRRATYRSMPISATASPMRLTMSAATYRAWLRQASPASRSRTRYRGPSGRYDLVSPVRASGGARGDRCRGRRRHPRRPLGVLSHRPCTAARGGDPPPPEIRGSRCRLPVRAGSADARRHSRDRRGGGAEAGQRAHWLAERSDRRRSRRPRRAPDQRRRCAGAGGVGRLPRGGERYRRRAARFDGACRSDARPRTRRILSGRRRRRNGSA